MNVRRGLDGLVDDYTYGSTERSWRTATAEPARARAARENCILKLVSRIGRLFSESGFAVEDMAKDW